MAKIDKLTMKPEYKFEAHPQLDKSPEQVEYERHYFTHRADLRKGDMYAWGYEHAYSRMKDICDVTTRGRIRDEIYKVLGGTPHLAEYCRRVLDYHLVESARIAIVDPVVIVKLPEDTKPSATRRWNVDLIRIGDELTFNCTLVE